MRYLGASAVGLLVGVVLALTGVLVARSVPPRPEATAERCDVDPSRSGYQGVCVQRRHAAPGLFTEAVDEVWVLSVYDGAPIDRYTYVPIPAQRSHDPFEVVVTGDGIEVTLDDGIRVWLPAEYYAVQ
ncbi:hypothetical protein DT076_18525 [Desertihabitans brevis]|uniref:Uncharacterized protein n=1 Tax=Desertihabitans brevis TaxID=2268447 RepID=A0A367YPY5_9ACTN|nr:hypothetical protein DT076_18525 [Desertihabitans brevis]